MSMTVRLTTIGAIMLGICACASETERSSDDVPDVEVRTEGDVHTNVWVPVGPFTAKVCPADSVCKSHCTSALAAHVLSCTASGSKVQYYCYCFFN